MKISWFTKISSGSIDTGHRAIDRMNNDPGHKTGNDQQDSSNDPGPFYPAHKNV